MGTYWNRRGWNCDWTRERLMAAYADKPAEDIDPLWFLLAFLDCFPNWQGLPRKKVSVKRWLFYLIQIRGSPLQSLAFECVGGDWIIRHGVNSSTYLQFKTSPKLFEQASKATNEHIKCAAQILANKRGEASIDYPAEIKALCKEVVWVSEVMQNANVELCDKLRLEIEIITQVLAALYYF
jgi:hypothetical protein